jgi:hypothetical protein
MDAFSTLNLSLFAAGTFAPAFVTGLAGFAFGIVAAAVWLPFLSPAQAAALIVAFVLIVQGVSVCKLRRAIKWARLLPFLLGGAIEVPIGANCCAGRRRAPAQGGRRDPRAVQLVQPRPPEPRLDGARRGRRRWRGRDLNGVIGGATGLAGIAAVIWCSPRGWPPAEQRAVFQPSGVAVFA